ncbi:MAG: hypothetical protein AB8G14_06945 [Ilumatobacter sp.]
MNLAAPERKLSRAAVISVGVTALLISIVMAPVLPVIVVGVCTWWLYDDLTYQPDRRPGGLGIAALVVFTVAAVVITTFITVLATNADCGAELFGAADAASSNFDQACADRERWRSVVAVSLTLMMCGLAAFGVRRSDATQSPTSVAIRTFGVAAGVVAGINVLLVAV